MQLLTISEKTKNNDQFVGDIIGLFPDTHVFSETEHSLFTIIPVALTEEEISAKYAVLQYSEEGNDVSMVTKDNEGNDVVTLVPNPPRYAIRYENGEIKENYSRALGV